jgi:glycerophosphoryl diester phosphodiesterase
MANRSAMTGPLRLPRVIGHRGAAGCAPENTLAGFRQARALGCAWVEFDVRLTADRQPILLHDERLERTTSGRGKAKNLQLSEIRRHDAGSWFGPDFADERVPTLDGALAVLEEEGLAANVEIKPSRGEAYETGKIAAETVARLWPERGVATLISSFLPAALAAAKATAPSLPRGLLFRALPKNWRRRAEELACVSIHLDHRRLSPAVVAEVNSLGYLLLAYTVNDATRARMLFDWGVAAVFSDVPHMILAGTEP